MDSSTLPAAAAADDAAARAARFLARLFPAPRPFAVRLWDGTLLPADGPPPFTLAIRSPGALRRIFRPPVELSIGEAFLRRDFDVEGDLAAAFRIVPDARSAARSPRDLLALAALWPTLPRDRGEGTLAVRAAARLSGALHSSARDRAAIRYHYDVGNDFYRLFLDERMVYSCAYFPTGAEDIDAAQEAKLELICRKLRLRAGERLLDIGCGWGGLLIHAARRHGVSGVGVTLSEAQCRLARERAAEAGVEDRVRIEQRDYRELEGESFDKLVSVGMFEHVGPAQLPVYFGRAHRLLAPGGLFLNHGISTRPRPAPRGARARLAKRLERAVVGDFAFRKRYIFPDADLAPLSEVNLAAERAGFEVRDVENLREHYVLTLRHWLDRLRRRRAEAVRVAGEPVYRLWELYLAGCVHHFETAQVNVNQTLLARPLPGGRVPLPLTRAEIYA